MLIGYKSNGNVELVLLDDNHQEPTQEKLVQLRSLYGDEAQFNFYIDEKYTREDFHNQGSHELIEVNGEYKLIIYKKISITSDKTQILADGIDTATITATVDDPTSTEQINFYINGELVSSENAVNGVAEIQINATQTGEIVIEAESTTKYRRNSITIEVVSA